MKSTAPMKNNISDNSGSTPRYGMFIPLALMIASVISSCFSYSNAKQNIANDLNDAMFALANENSELWTRPDTIAAIRHMHETTHKPLIYQASDVNFRNPTLKDEAYFTLALVDNKNASHRIGRNKIASDSIMLVPEHAADGLAIQVQGFVDCSMASIFYASDQTLPGILFSLSVLSMASMLIWKRKETETTEAEFIAISASPSLDDIKLTPMQRQLTLMLLEAPDMKVDKRSLCESLWGNKSNAEESLYTLVKRTKNALVKANMEIVCNRGDSYELRI
ncbi:MAG: helix-turn-helix domain-containing protein, partial [Muribaculaceae bacterium]|nr:helix-turn-helix domain-containing protein [Muribaculaceae bacterium]